MQKNPLVFTPPPSPMVTPSSPETADPLSLRDIPLTGGPLHKGGREILRFAQNDICFL